MAQISPSDCDDQKPGPRKRPTKDDELLVVRFDLVHGYDLEAMENQKTEAIFSKEVHMEGWI